MTVSTASHEAAERRTAARALLKTPILTTNAPAELTLVRRHAKTLKQLFFSRFGYNLIVETSFARLFKAGLDAGTPTRAAQRSTEQDFTPRHYTYLALTCSALLSPTVGEQVLLSALADQIRADAVLAGLSLPDTIEQARHLTQALYLLMEWGVISETDGAIASWGTRQEECLLDVNRPLLPHLLATTLREASTPGELLTVREDHFNPEAPRRSLRRKLVENPLVRREDLSEAERDVLSRERRDLARRLDEDFGLILEVRSEGALVYDPDEELTDVLFPGKGTVAHAALLLLDALTDTLRPTAESRAQLDGADVPGVFAPSETVWEEMLLIIEQYGSAFAERYKHAPDTLIDEAVSLLNSLSLTRSVKDGLILHPACARYRPEPQKLPSRPRHVVDHAADSLDGLFTDPDSSEQGER
ncbi:TIGR02678 family protein [Kribbella speibonae]|uniref:TIGR02678 family protein n=1 Tax=Kribbella speibonae TaxID=1572660 RepID=A0A4R0IHG4_9ACTN|nr:TIGR02678 family protein [Kribbella speibonae]TCC32037.1 TIGR02678 family protein [Kribbella speibonae]